MTDIALIETLLPAYGPCPHFAGACRGACVWDPPRGLVPCAFGGATGSVEEVRLVLVTAEPSDPADNAIYEGGSQDMIRRALGIFDRAIRTGDLGRIGRPTPFHRNMRKILDLCWPGLDVDAQLRLTWTTNAVLCAAPVSGGSHPLGVELICARTYLAEQLALLPNAFVIALGGKAARRMRQANLRFDAEAQHPSARPNTDPERSWRAAAASFRAWLGDAFAADAKVFSQLREAARNRSAAQCGEVPDGPTQAAQERASPKTMLDHVFVAENTMATDLIVKACAKALQSPGTGRGWRLKAEYRPGTSYAPIRARRPALDLAHALHAQAPEGIVTEGQLLMALELANPLMKAAGNQAGANEWRQFLLKNKAKGGAWYEPA